MKTRDALAIGIKLGRLQRTMDAWEESKHPRANNGQFSHSAGSGSTPAESKNGAPNSTSGPKRDGATPKTAQAVKPDDKKYNAKGKQVYKSASDFPKYISSGGNVYVKQMPLKEDGYDYEAVNTGYGAVKYVKQYGDCENENEYAVWINTAGNAAWGFRGD